MRAYALLKRAFETDGWGFVAWVAVLLAGCTALISGEWVTALLFISLAALFGAVLCEAVESPAGENPPRWPERVILAAGIGLLGVACVHVVDSEVIDAVLAGLAGAMIVAGAIVGRLKASAGRLSQGRH